MNERLHILGKAKTAKTETGFEELAADARIEADGVGDFLDVSSDALAEIGQDIGVADF